MAKKTAYRVEGYQWEARTDPSESGSGRFGSYTVTTMGWGPIWKDPAADPAALGADIAGRPEFTRLVLVEHRATGNVRIRRTSADVREYRKTEAGSWDEVPAYWPEPRRSPTKEEQAFAAIVAGRLTVEPADN